ncbi:hypothetical protein H4I95_11940 [Botrytis cinerea]
MASQIQHRMSMKHCPCLCCDPFDSQEELREAHQPSIDKYSCPKCKQRFAQKPSLEAHQRESHHAYCYKCDIVSSTRFLNALHMQSHFPVQKMRLSPVAQFQCCDCERDFKNEKALANHLLYSQAHALWKEPEKTNTQNQKYESDQPTKCKKCPRAFKNWAALKQHLMSIHHKPLRDIKYIADIERKKHSNRSSAQLHHLEARKLVSRITKTKLNAAIAVNDTEKIVNPEVTIHGLLGNNISKTSASQIRSPILTSTSTEFLDSHPSSAIFTPTLSAITKFYSILTLLWPRNSHGYQTCPLCPLSSTRKFKHDALQQHLSSSVHNWSFPYQYSTSHHPISRVP